MKEKEEEKNEMPAKDQNNPYFQDDEILSAEQDLPAEIKEKKKTGTLKTGYTTGTTATAATKAALYALLHGKTLESVTVTLPKGQTAQIKVAWTKLEQGTCIATCIKYGGDDPDVTHGAEICSTVFLTANPGVITIDGGTGVGRVTKPGLGLQIGSAAINPVPMKMLEQGVREVASDQLKAKGVTVIISVPKGEEIASKTDNPRLGILGGISILGTTGIVLPYSTASFAASIRQSLDVAIAMGSDTVVLTTGGRSEDFAKELFKGLPDHCFVQMGDFAGYSIKQCAAKKIRKAIIAAFIGKLTKMAMGVKQTHVAGSHVDMEFMASIASQCGTSEQIVQEIRQANTARHVSEIVTKHGISSFFNLMCRRVWEQMREYSKGALDIEVIMFEFDGKIIGRYPDKVSGIT